MSHPYVLVNMAMTADGKVDSVERRGMRISTPADLARVDALRARSDAIMIGARTLLAEDPRLTVQAGDRLEDRRVAGLPEQPAKVAVASRIPPPGRPGGLPLESRFLLEGGARVIVLTTRATEAGTLAWLRGQGADVKVQDESRVDLSAGLRALADRGLRHVMAEGGGTLVAALMAEGLVHELRLYVAPMLLGGATAPTPMDGPGLPAADAMPIHLSGVTRDDDGGLVLRYAIRPWEERDPTTRWVDSAGTRMHHARGRGPPATRGGASTEDHCLCDLRASRRRPALEIRGAHEGEGP